MDNTIVTVRDEFLNVFMTTTPEYLVLDETNDKQKREDLVKNSMDYWMTYLYLANSSQDKYGTLMTGFRTQYSLQNDQYPKDITSAYELLQGHMWDPAYNIKKKNKKQE